MLAMSVLAHLGNDGLKSGNEVTPGQSSSLGVPRMLLILVRTRCNLSVNVPENLEDLVNLGITREQRLARAHLSKDAAHRPHVYTRRVLAATEQNFW